MGWLGYLTVPVVAAAIGYITKRAAIWMMFHPVHFVGLAEPFLGWQGVVPRNSERIIRKSARLLTTRLVTPREILARLDPKRVAEEIELPLLLAIDEITRDLMRRYHPALWESLPELARELVVKQVQAGAPALVDRIVSDIRDSIDEVVDVEQIAVRALHRDRALLVRLIRDISRPELAFIARSGCYFGFLLGLVQTVVWALTHHPLVLPLFGLLIGASTDWLAIKLVFFPRERVRILGLVPFQGVFQRRRDEVAREYGELIAREVLTVPNLIDGLLRGPRADRLIDLVQHAVRDTIDEQAEQAGAFVPVGVGSRRFQEMKDAAAARAVRYLPSTARLAGDYVAATLDVRNTVITRMRGLTRVEYEELLRPAFRRDEWKLIAVGALIGGLVGELQALVMLH